MTTSIFKSLVLSTTLLVSAGCSQNGFQTLDGLSNSQGSSDNASSGTGGTTSPSVPTESAYDKLQMAGYVSGGTYDGDQVMALDKENNALLLYLPVPGVFFNFYTDKTAVNGVKIVTQMNSQQKARVAVSIPLRLLVKDKVQTIGAGTLPNGDALPAVASGEPLTLGLSLNLSSKMPLYTYFGVSAVGIFLESSFFPEYISLTMPIKNKNGLGAWGFLTIVPKKGSHNGGLFLSVKLPNDIARIIDQHLSGVIN